MNAFRVILCALVGTVCKLALSLTSLGTNDVVTARQFGEVIGTQGLVAAYESLPDLNHPPLMAGFFALLWRHGGSPEEFAVWFRLASILADLGTIFLVWKISTFVMPRAHAAMTTAIVALSPALVFVSGFHGNTDPIMALFIALGLYLLAVEQRPVWAAVAIGLALNVKIAPVILLPAFVAWLRPWRARIAFVGGVGAVVALGYGYWFAQAPGAMLSNIVGYSSVPGAWGLTRIFSGYSPTHGKVALVLSCLVVAWTTCRPFGPVEADPGIRAAGLVRAFSLTFLAFFLVTPGFGPQYLVWLVVPIALVGPLPNLVVSVLAGALLFAIYTFWSEAFPWYFADAIKLGFYWPNSFAIIDVLLWGTLVIVTLLVAIN